MHFMSNKELALFIFEGSKTEEKLIRKLEQNFMGNGHSIKCVFDAEVYQLYRCIKAEEPFQLDIVSMLKERRAENAEILKGYTRDSFAYIYLFFDYDAHSTMADDLKIDEMLKYFDNESENGMMYISYPMVEAIRHYRDLESFKDLAVKCKRANCPYIANCATKDECMKEPHYKAFVSKDSRPQLTNTNGYTTDVWKELINAHLFKMNYVVNDSFEFPSSLCSQRTIFNKQKEKYIDKKCPMVAVLSAIPLYLLDYYGCSRLSEKLK